MKVYEVIHGEYMNGYRSVGMYLKKEDADAKAKALAAEEKMIEHNGHYFDDPTNWVDYITVKEHFVHE